MEVNLFKKIDRIHTPQFVEIEQYYREKKDYIPSLYQTSILKKDRLKARSKMCYLLSVTWNWSLELVRISFYRRRCMDWIWGGRLCCMWSLIRRGSLGGILRSCFLPSRRKITWRIGVFTLSCFLWIISRSYTWRRSIGNMQFWVARTLDLGGEISWFLISATKEISTGLK